jgi:signal transduction histidine kinase
VRERRTEIPYPGILLMFAAFIFLCGSTHVMEIWTVWHPDYRQAGLLKALTGIISVATMLALFRIMPQALQLHSPLQLQIEVQSRTAELARVNEQLREQIAARDLDRLSVIQPDERIEIMADPLRLSQAISNLLTNAAKFTPHGGRITLAAARTGASLSITVTDSGIGFDPAAAPMLFEMFSQANVAAEASEGGLGIGLSLVRGLVQLHGGTVGGHSPGKGQGAEFTITLPATMLSQVAPTANLTPVACAIPAAPSKQARVLIGGRFRPPSHQAGGP